MTTTVAGTGRGRQKRPASRSRNAFLVSLLPLAIALIVIAMLVSVTVGSKGIAPLEVWQSLVSPSDRYADLVVASRLPRTLLGVLVGASLAVAGAIMQGITRNPLGDPGLLGVNAGAAASVVTAAAFLGADAAGRNVWIALPGAVLAAVAAYTLGSSRGKATPVRLVLAGAVITAIVAAYIQAITLSNPDVFETYRFWVIGSLAGRSAESITTALPFMVVGLVLAVTLGRALNTIALGDDTATALGAHPAATRALGLAATTILCAAATAVVGPIGFVGLAVPHLVRAFTGDDYRWLVPFSALLGGSLLLFADIIGRVILPSGELAVGVVTAFLGAPFLIIAVRRTGTAR